MGDEVVDCDIYKDYDNKKRDRVQVFNVSFSSSFFFNNCCDRKYASFNEGSWCYGTATRGIYGK